jgi:HPt (histidine-containing phosphotransfer) domain-containing protein
MAAIAVRVAAGAHRPGPIDAEHLAQMTFGDRRLEREVLEIFRRQSVIMLSRIGGVEPGAAAAAIHTLKGSARGIGAWRVARAAERLEQACGEADRAASLAELQANILEARAAIDARLESYSNQMPDER